MPEGRTVFAQLMDVVPRRAFERYVTRDGGHHRVRAFSCYDQYLCLAFAQLTYRGSLRDIETCLRALQPTLYHAGLRGRVSRSTLADANETRNWRIYGDFAQTLIRRARQLYCDEPFAVELTQTAYAFDATTIDLCLALFPWAHFRRHKAAVKLHTLLDLRARTPTLVAITPGKTADVTLLDALVVEPGAFYVVDRGYTDFGRLYRLAQGLAFFVIRGKRRLDYVRRASRPVDKTTGLRSDQTIVLCGPKTATLYPDPLRRITYVDLETGKRFVFLTNNFADLSTPFPSAVARMTTSSWRWTVEDGVCCTLIGRERSRMSSLPKKPADPVGPARAFPCRRDYVRVSPACFSRLNRVRCGLAAPQLILANFGRNWRSAAARDPRLCDKAGFIEVRLGEPSKTLLSW